MNYSNYIERSDLLDCQNFLQHYSICLNFLCNYFYDSTKLFSNLYLANFFLDTSTKSFFPYGYSRFCIAAHTAIWNNILIHKNIIFNLFIPLFLWIYFRTLATFLISLKTSQRRPQIDTWFFYLLAISVKLNPHIIGKIWLRFRWNSTLNDEYHYV